MLYTLETFSPPGGTPTIVKNFFLRKLLRRKVEQKILLIKKPVLMQAFFVEK